MEPKIIKRKVAALRECVYCKDMHSSDNFVQSRVWFYKDGLATVCNSCIKTRLKNSDWSWNEIDDLCMMLNIPFIPMEWDRLFKINGDDTFPVYAKILQETPFEGLDWSQYNDAYKEIQEYNLLERELPELYEKRIKELRATWGENYDDTELEYLEGLMEGMMLTQSINGALQNDQAHKICKISLEIDNRIRGALDFDKLMGSYDKMVKTAGFTPKTLKNDNDFDSFGEVFAWLEKRGWENKYYDGASRDVVDEVIQNLQAFNQRLYVNESGIGDEITARIEALKSAQSLEARGPEKPEDFDLDVEDNLDDYENEGYQGLKEGFTLDEDEEGAYV